MKKITGIFCLLMILSFTCYPQSDTAVHCALTFSGKVLDGETKEPLPGATVFFRGTDKGTVANMAGNFVIRSLCAGEYTVECYSFGYKAVVYTVVLSRSTVRNFVLHADTCVMESVVIDIEEVIPEETQSVVQLGGKDLDRTKGLSLGEALKILPGVNALQTGPTIFKPVIQGLYGNRVLVMNNGVRQEGQQWGSEHGLEVDPFIASRFTVIKGASGVQYGSDAIGGVILIEPEELRKVPGIGGEVNLIGFSNNRQGVASGQLDFQPVKIKGLSFRVQGTYKRGGNTRTPEYYMKNTGLKEYNFSWAAGYNGKRFQSELFYSQFNSKIGIFSASHIGNLTDLQKAINSPVPLETSGFTYEIDRPYQDIAHELFKVKNKYHLSKIGKLELTLARQFNYRAEFDKHHSGNDDDEPEVKFKITSHTALLQLEHHSIGRVKGTGGINFIRQANTTAGTARSFIPNFQSYAGGVFLIERWRKKKTELEAGVRYDYKWMKVYRFEKNVLETPEFAFSNISGVLGGIYTLNDEWKLRLNLGTAFRPVTVNELFSDGLHHGSSRLEYGNRNLRPEYAYNASLTLNYKFLHIYGEINLYNNFIDDYIYLAPGLVFDSAQQNYVPEYALTVRGAFPVFRYKQINALFTGADWTFNDSLSRRIIFSSRLSILRAYNTTDKEHIILAPPANFEYGVKYHVNFSGKVEDCYLRLTHLFTARKNKVSANQDVSVPPPAYMLFSLETGFRWYAGKQPLDLTFTVYNLLNTKYRDYMDRFRYFTDAAGRNFVIRVKIPFNFSGRKISETNNLNK